MSTPNDELEPPDWSGQHFVTTHWSAILTAAHKDRAQAAEALEQICRAYWYPVYAYIRRKGWNSDQARDLTQGFFARLLEKDYLAGVQPGIGRFRWFLLSAVKRFLSNERQHALAQKRGGRAFHVPFDGEKAEDRYGLETADHLTPDKLYDRAWAVNLIESAGRSLEEECVLEGKAELFNQLRDCLGGEKGHESYAEIGKQLHMSEGAVKVAVHRLRRRYREIVRGLIGQTVTTRTEVEEELRDLLAAFSE